MMKINRCYPLLARNCFLSLLALLPLSTTYADHIECSPTAPQFDGQVVSLGCHEVVHASCVDSFFNCHDCVSHGCQWAGQSCYSTCPSHLPCYAQAKYVGKTDDEICRIDVVANQDHLTCRSANGSCEECTRIRTHLGGSCFWHRNGICSNQDTEEDNGLGDGVTLSITRGFDKCPKETDGGANDPPVHPYPLEFPHEPSMPDENEVFLVPLEPFSLTLDATMDDEDLQLESYILDYMQIFTPNLIAISLKRQLIADETDIPAKEEDDSNNSTGRNLLAHQAMHRVLPYEAFHYKGNATFEGLPVRSREEVNTALTYVLEDTAALQMHFLEITSLNSSTPIGPLPADQIVTGLKAAQTEEYKEEGGLSSTGLAIVIIAACVGGIFLTVLIIKALSGDTAKSEVQDSEIEELAEIEEITVGDIHESLRVRSALGEYNIEVVDLDPGRLHDVKLV